jgi:phage gpG-like protein
MMTLRPSPQSQQHFNQTIEHIQDLTTAPAPLVTAIQQAICEEFERNFASESDAGLSWPRLSEVTIRIRLAEGFGAGPILVRTGDYKRSWVEPTHPQHIHELRQSTSHWSVEEGTQHPYAVKHELGTDRIPARPASHVTVAGEARIGRVIEEGLKRILNQK